MERKVLSLPCGVRMGGDSAVQIMKVDISGETSNLYLELDVMNHHSGVLNALDYEVIFYNSILEKLNNDPYIINQRDFTVSKGKIGSTGKYHIPVDFSDARKVDITLVRGYFDDGNELDLKYTNSEIVMIDNLGAKQKNILQENAGEDAISLAQSNNLSWRCVCGYFNYLEVEVCGNCERNKEEVLQNYSSLEGLSIKANQKMVSEETDEESKQATLKENEIVQKNKKQKVKKENPIKKLLDNISSQLSVLDKKSKFFLIGTFVLLFVSIILWVLF